MNEKDIEHLKRILQNDLAALLAKAGEAVGELLDTVYTNEADPLDRATKAQARNDQLNIRDRERRLIAKIEKSLQAIDDQTYGICENCEEPIAVARLKARPVTSYCITCKTEQEARERITGR